MKWLFLSSDHCSQAHIIFVSEPVVSKWLFLSYTRLGPSEGCHTVSHLATRFRCTKTPKCPIFLFKELYLKLFSVPASHVCYGLLTHCSLGDVEVILHVYFSNSFYELICWTHPVKLEWVPQIPSDNKSTLVQVMAWWWHQAITWANVDLDLCRHITSPGYNLLS